MLLTCPACGARYEIDGSLIPASGRRVQCSSCDHVWQEGPPPGAAPAPPPAGPPRDAVDDAPRQAAPPADEAAEPPSRRPPLAEDVKAILRSEAQREARVRRERGLVEIQPELSLAPGAALPRRRPRPAPDALPDPDEINQTLRAASMRAAQARHEGSRGRTGGGFAFGLIVGLCLVGLAALVYAIAPRIADAVPAAEPALGAYVAAVGETRDVLDRAVSGAAEAVSDLVGSGS